MTPREVIYGVAIVAIVVIVAQYLADRRTIRRYGAHCFELGWAEGWDDRDADRYPDTPEPKGRHHGISQPSDWDATDLIEFTLPPPLPKRKARA